MIRIASILITLLVAQSVPADERDVRAAKARRIASQVQLLTGVPGLSVAVAVDGRIVFAEGFGWANVELRAPVTTNTRFRTASVAKPLTAAIAARLAERGTLDLDRPVREYLPGIPESMAKITARQLCSHFGGVRHYLRGESDTLYDKHFDTARDALPKFTENSPMQHEAGERMRYTTYGYVLLSATLEAAAGKTFSELLTEELDGPIGMPSTCVVDPRKIIPNRTSFYRRDRGVLRNAEFADLSYKFGGGGLLSTPSDLARFGVAMSKPGYLKPETHKRQFEPMTSEADPDNDYAMGWGTGTRLGGRSIQHSGGQLGAASYLLLQPDSGLVSATMANVGGAPTSPLAEAMALCFDPKSRSLNPDELAARSGVYDAWVIQNEGEQGTGQAFLQQVGNDLRGEAAITRSSGERRALTIISALAHGEHIVLIGVTPGGMLLIPMREQDGLWRGWVDEDDGIALELRKVQPAATVDE